MKISSRRFLLDVSHAIAHLLDVDGAKAITHNKTGSGVRERNIDEFAVYLGKGTLHIMPNVGDGALAVGYNPAQLCRRLVDLEKGWRLLTDYEMAYGYVPSDLQVWDEETQCWTPTQQIPRQDATYRTRTLRLSPYLPTQEGKKRLENENPYNQTIVAKHENFRVGWAISHPSWEKGEGAIIGVSKTFLSFFTNEGVVRHRKYPELVGHLVREPGKSTWMRVIGS